MKRIKGWTAHTAVKIVCFLLMPVLCFQAVRSFYSGFALTSETGVQPDVLLADLSANKYFHERHMSNAYYHAMVAAYYGSEEAILRGDYLLWTEHPSGLELTTPDKSVQYAWIGFGDDGEKYIPFDSDSPDMILIRRNEEQNAIKWQIEEFRWAMEHLRKTDGLVYNLSGHGGTVEGSIMADIGWFETKPVYVVRDGKGYVNSSHGADFGYLGDGGRFDYGYWDRFDYGYGDRAGSADERHIYLAFEAEYVNAQNYKYRVAQQAYLDSIVGGAGGILLALLLLAVLLLGAGRRRGNDNEELRMGNGELGDESLDSDASPGLTGREPEGRAVHFVFIDKLFLDLGFVLLLLWCLAAGLLADDTIPYIQRTSTPSAMIAFLTAISVAMVIPAILWILSLAKRIKAGKFWRHTLIYFVPSAAVRLLRSLWAGAQLTAKAALIAFASFMLMFFVMLTTAIVDTALAVVLTLIFTGTALFFLLRYAARIRRLKDGAIAAEGGDYSTPIDAGGGELGSIAKSISNISAGINTAVEERMKSERLKTELITNVSHDIRTPLTSIITYTDLLKNEGLDADAAPEYLDVLVQKSQRLKTLTDELFEAAKAATGNIDLNIAELDIVSLINQVLGELDSALKASGLNLRVNLPEKLLVKADGKLMWRVMENLLSNAFKYSLIGSRAYLDVTAEGSLARIDLKNISAEELNFDPAELTERFKRGDESRADGGSGLGLSIVQSFIKAQGGSFLVSIDGDLFKATVHLPLK